MRQKTAKKRNRLAKSLVRGKPEEYQDEVIKRPSKIKSWKGRNVSEQRISGYREAKRYANQIISII